eukprot:GFYU01006311.1.p1 GENE.GFYU01006311.1~~GFYU01006311.1.p1  ORF type:complete len:793 (+),score=164.15 GFYU01006311.1:341-2719(+)
MNALKDNVEIFAEALIREYLSRQGCKHSLAAFDSERPRDGTSLTSRTEIAKGLKLERNLKKNKQKEKPYLSMIEVILEAWFKRSTLETQGSSKRLLSAKPSRPETSRPAVVPATHEEREGDGIDDDLGIINDDDDERQIYTRRPSAPTLTTRPATSGTVLGRISVDPESEVVEAPVNPVVVNRPRSSRPVAPDTPMNAPETPLPPKVQNPPMPTDVRPITTTPGPDRIAAMGMGMGMGMGNQANAAVTPIDVQKIRPRSGRVSPTPSQRPQSSRVRHAGSERDLYADPIEDEIDTFLQEVDDLDIDLTSTTITNAGGGTVNETAATTTTRREYTSSTVDGPAGSATTASYFSQRTTISAQQSLMTASTAGGKPMRPATASQRPESALARRTSVEDMMVEDVDLDEGWNDSGAGGGGGGPIRQTYMGSNRPPSASVQRPMTAQASHTITVDVAKEIRQVVFGRQAEFSESWHQGFFFSDIDMLKYGLCQHSGGPCGVIAAVQASFLHAYLYLGENANRSHDAIMNPSTQRRTETLMYALAGMLWQARGEHDSVKVVLSKSKEYSARITKNISELCTVYEFHTLDAVTRFISSKVSMFTDPYGPGVILMVFSMMLTRGIDNIKGDMDDPNASLIGEFGYCTQEMVNLFLVGKAHTNVFDGQMYLDSGSDEDGMVLRGIASQSTVGYLTLMETLKYVNVGANFKEPKYPIWVICSESHYSVLFSVDRKCESRPEFDLYYYDELARQDEEIRLTVSIGDEPAVEAEPDMIPPLNNIIRTKWGPNANVDWHDVDPLL